MSDGIKRIDSIKKVAVFQDFQWASFMRDGGNNIADFKNINILYGRNYSGKTTLSRIFRALETGSLPDKWDSPEFELSFTNGSRATHSSLTSHGQIVRVFNEDFIRDNLRFIVDDEQTITSFAILGEDNTRIEQEIKTYEEELGSEEDESGLLGKLLAARKAHDVSYQAHEDKKSELEKKLREKANNKKGGIKHNKLYGNANYNVSKIKEDISTVTQDTYALLSEEQVGQYRDLLKEEPKEEIAESPSPDLQYSAIISRAKELVEKRIQPSAPIQELLNDATLAEWARAGRRHHQEGRDTCAFCGGIIPDDLWEKLDMHFNQESEELRQELELLEELIESERSLGLNYVEINYSDFYSAFKGDLEPLEEQWLILSASYRRSLESVKEQVEKRREDIFTSFEFNVPESVEEEMKSIQESFEKVREESNKYTSSLSANQTKARTALRLHEVYSIVTDVQYLGECAAIAARRKEMEKASQYRNNVREEVTLKRRLVDELKSQLKDESKGADRVNVFLNNFFGHESLSLRAIEEVSGDASSRYRFEVMRNDKKAYHLSEGECSLIAFCYFMAKLEDTETKGNQPIIWIDDPISSLDANHIFFVYGLINAGIVSPERNGNGGNAKELTRFKQLFVSTHNLDFLKYLKRLPGARDMKKTQYFLITRSRESSQIGLMPRYLRDYVTEFNYLFHQICKCASVDTQSSQEYECFYNFGNNARKFLEAFLYYKYPNALENDDKLERFFGSDTLAASLTDRVNNEYSHLAGTFERSVQPIDVPEMSRVAKFILKKIEEKDPDQYAALLQSVGEQCSFLAEVCGLQTASAGVDLTA